jgi:protein disulfide-isomerase A1
MYFLSLALCLFVFGIRASVPETEDGVYVLSDANFGDFVADNDFSFVEFYAPWCGHCKSLAPVFIKVAEAFSSSTSVKLAKVDCTQQKTICSDVQGYPTIKLFSKTGKIVDYDGERSEAALTAFITKRTGPASTRLNTAQELTTFLEGSTKSKLVAYIDESSVDYDTWKDIASSPGVELFSFGHADTSIAGEKRRTIELIVEGKDTVTFVPESAFLNDQVLNWITEHGFPLVETLSQETWNRATTHPTSKFLAAVFYDKAQEAPTFVESVAGQFKGSVVFSLSDTPQILERWGGSGTFFPSAVVLNFNGAQPELFTWDESSGIEMTAESLKAFVEESVAGTYKSNIKSEPIPEKNDEPVRTLVAKNYEKVITNPENKVILVEFYAPWCGHCKKLAPTLDELGTNFASNSGVVIAKFDATANTVPKGISVTGFPTILAFVNGEQHPYPGGHDIASLTAFVESFIKDAADSDDGHADL